jgi:NAD-dependent dihydropyrimidine dehydrogenase PreA subunit
MLEISCLGYLDSQVLVAIALQGTKVYLDVAGERCSTCGGKGAGLALAELKKAERILHALDEKENVGSAGSVTEAEAEVKLLSRDEFLGFCRRKIGTEFKKNVTLLLEIQENSSPGQKSGKGNNGEVARKLALPEHRRLLLESLAQKGYQRGEKLVEVDSLPFGRVKISDNCTLCGDCTVFCPTGALKKSVQEGNVAITHRPAQCLKCGLCALGCQVKALEYMRTLDLEQVLSGEEIKVFQLTVKRCIECDAEITIQSESGLCYSCQTYKEIESDIDKVFANEFR